ncbi:MAG: SusC/RagA family TonB-linked outer membrane protein [Gemmatimonadaceae bacterium]
MAVVRRLLLALVVGLLCTARLGAQNPTGTITGRVVDSTTQLPLSDVSVIVDGTGRGAVTQADGTFIIGGVPAGNHTVRVRRIGFSSPPTSVTVTAGGTASVQFSLERRVAVLEEVVTTGYGSQRRLAITGSVSTIDATRANVGIQPNVTNMIEGRAAGVQITQNDGAPGAGAQILIRGGTSISASNEPLYVIDGIAINNVETENTGVCVQCGSPSLPRNPMNLINPSDIQSISILKDAAATAIYGSRAANGVILIETKKGVGAPSMEYEVQAGMSSPRKYLGLLNGTQYRQFIADQIAAGNMPGSRPAEDTANTDWERAITRSAPTLNQNFSFAGGSASTQYRASVNYLDQEGIVINNGMRRYQARLNGTHQAIDGKLRLGLNLTGSHVINDFLPYENTGGFQGGVFINTVYYNPTHPITLADASGSRVYYETGPGTQALDNPVALANQVQSKGTDDRTLGNLSADYDLFPSLTARVNIGIDRVAGDRNDFLPAASPVGAQFNGLAQRTNRDNTSKTLQTLLTFHPTFTSSREFELVGGYEFNQYDFNEFGAQSQDFLTDALGYNALGSGATLVTPFSSASDSRLVSFFGRANASLNDKYFLTGVLRKDGSSTFGIGNKWAVFPAISGSWRLSQESFMRTGPFSELRLRAGWGKVGNPGAPPYASLILLTADGGSRYVFGETPVTGFSPSSNPNPNLKWESTTEDNLALDYGFFADRITGSLEYYVKNTKDLLLTVNVPQPAVTGTRLENVGRLQNKGVEFSLDGKVLNRPTNNWTAGIVFAKNNNKVVDLGPYSFLSEGTVSGQGLSGVNAQRIIPGQPLGTFYGPQFVGVNANGQQLFNHYVVTRDAQGRETGRTLSGTVTAAALQGDDFVVLGNGNPKYTLGFRGSGNIGKFDISFLINREAGQKVFNNTALTYATKSNALTDKNFLLSALSQPDALNEPSIYSSRWIEDGSFTRLQNVTVGYTFDLPRFTGVARNSRVYLSGDNLLLITGYTGYDPEVFTDAGLGTRGIDYLHYPRPRTITGGLRVSF